MNLPTSVVIIKAVGFVGAGICVSLVTNLAQWMNTEVWPSRISWLIIIVGAAGAGFNALLSFLSSAYSDYVQTRANGNGNSGPGPTAVAASKPSAS